MKKTLLTIALLGMMVVGFNVRSAAQNGFRINLHVAANDGYVGLKGLYGNSDTTVRMLKAEIMDAIGLVHVEVVHDCGMELRDETVLSRGCTVSGGLCTLGVFGSLTWPGRVRRLDEQLARFKLSPDENDAEIVRIEKELVQARAAAAAVAEDAAAAPEGLVWSA